MRYINLYRGPSIPQATLVSVCTDRDTVDALADRLLHPGAPNTNEPTSDIGPRALSWLALYRGPSIESATLAGISASRALVAEFCDRILESGVFHPPPDDPIRAGKIEAERQGVELVLKEARESLDLIRLAGPVTAGLQLVPGNDEKERPAASRGE